jgi:hypothetical protein
VYGKEVMCLEGMVTGVHCEAGRRRGSIIEIIAVTRRSYWMGMVSGVKAGGDGG